MTAIAVILTIAAVVAAFFVGLMLGVHGWR